MPKNYLKSKIAIIGRSGVAEPKIFEKIKEVTLANELGLEYASLCSIDNYAHGIIKKPLTIKEIQKNQLKMAKKLKG